MLLSGCNHTKDPDPFEWQSLGLDGKRIFELTTSENYLYAAAGKDGMYRKDLNNLTSEWEYLGLAEPEVNFGIRTFYRNSDTGTMYAGFFEHNWDGPGLFKSINDGQSWEAFVTGIIEQFEGQSAFLTKLTAPQDQPSQIFAGTSSAIFKLKEDNSGWKFLNESAEFGKGVLSISFNSQNNQEIWAGGRSGFDTGRLIFTNDGGETWDARMNGFGDLVNLTNEVQAITLNPNQPDIIYACLSYEILKSEDRGESWMQLESDLNSDEEFRDRSNDIFRSFTDLSINPLNPDEIIASGRFLYKSRDAGDTWEVVSDTTRSAILDMQVNWDNRVVYGSLLLPERGVFKIEI